MAVGALLAGLVIVPATPSAAVADTNCPTPVAFSQGAGTQASPYEVSAPGHLQTLRDDSANGWDKYYLLTTDIDMSANSNPCVWTTTIGDVNRAFTGVLDGGGHVVSGLDVSVSTGAFMDYAGLVGHLGSPGQVTRIGFTGNSTAVNSGGGMVVYAGGLVGAARDGSTISYSFATGNVIGTGSFRAEVGGLVGLSYGLVQDSYSTGSATISAASEQFSGGFSGYATTTSSMIRNYSTGVPALTSGPYVGGFSGVRQNGVFTANFWDTTSSTKSSAYGFAVNLTAGVEGKTTAQMQSFATFDDSAWPIVTGWAPFDIAADKVWGICEGVTRPFLLWQYTSQTRPCASTPSAPSITSVSPATTTASVAFTADDSGGSSITRIEFALDDTTTVDDSTANVSSPATLSGLTMSTDYTLYMRAVNAQGPGPWSAPISFRTQGRPGTPVITGITPDETTASVAFTADDSGGSSILAIQFALDDTTAVDGSATNVSPIAVAGLSSSTTYTFYIRAINANGPSLWSAPASFTTLTPSPTPVIPVPLIPVPPSAPLDVRATPGDRSVAASWSAPLAPGSYPVTNYQATANPGGRSCMTALTTCRIDGLVNGEAYTVTVRALSGAGWSTDSRPSEVVVPRASEGVSLTITGSRGSGADRRMITVRGISSGLSGERVRFWMTHSGRTATPSAVSVTIKPDGTFTWSRKLNRATAIYAESAGVRSNAIRLPAAR